MVKTLHSQAEEDKTKTAEVSLVREVSVRSRLSALVTQSLYEFRKGFVAGAVAIEVWFPNFGECISFP